MLSPTKIINEETDFLKGSVLLFNKPLGWSSFDVVKKIRSIIKSSRKIKKIKVGHAGTLDPLATGLLIICTGSFTKKISMIQKQPKIYTGEMILGATTPSYDKETKINKLFDVSHITDDLVYKSCEKFEGEIMQTPPIFSALKKNGERLYNYARQGDSVEIHPRKIYIDYFKITEIKMPNIKFSVKCSTGTYIRSLVNDYGIAMNSGGYLSSLKRSQIGDYKLSDCFSIDQFQSLF